MAPVSPAEGALRLHYVFDPFCGWCWAVAPLIAASRQQQPELPLVLHGVGGTKKIRETAIIAPDSGRN